MLTNQHTDETQILLSVMRVVMESPEENVGVFEFLNAKLGVGWLREYACTRSVEERLDMLRRRLFKTVRALDLSMADSLCNVTAFEDGGAR